MTEKSGADASRVPLSVIQGCSLHVASSAIVLHTPVTVPQHRNTAVGFIQRDMRPPFVCITSALMRLLLTFVKSGDNPCHSISRDSVKALTQVKFEI